MTDLAIQSLTIYLARPGTTLTQLIKPKYSARVPYNIQIDAATSALLYIEQPTSNRPDWVWFFDGYLDLDEFGRNASTGALLLVEVQSKYFALSFGRGRILLNDEYVEEKF